MRNLGPASVATMFTRLCPASASIRSSTSSSVCPETLVAAATVHPSAKTDRVASSCCSASRVGRRSIRRLREACVDVPGDRPGPCPARRARFRAERATRPGSSNRVRAAASSMASGRPSRRRQISTTASALSSVRAKSYRTAWARSTNSCTAGNDASCSIGGCSEMQAHSAGRPDTPARRGAAAPCGSWPGPRGPGSRTGAGRARAPHRPLAPGCPTRATSASLRNGQPERRPADVCPRGSPHRGGDARQNHLGLCNRSERHEDRPRAAQRSSSCSPTAIASRVLPTPPGPVRVTNRTSGDSSSLVTSAMSCWRPINDVDETGRERRSRRTALDADNVD